MNYIFLISIAIPVFFWWVSWLYGREKHSSKWTRLDFSWNYEELCKHPAWPRKEVLKLQNKDGIFVNEVELKKKESALVDMWYLNFLISRDGIAWDFANKNLIPSDTLYFKRLFDSKDVKFQDEHDPYVSLSIQHGELLVQLVYDVDRSFDCSQFGAHTHDDPPGNKRCVITLGVFPFMILDLTPSTFNWEGKLTKLLKLYKLRTKSDDYFRKYEHKYFSLDIKQIYPLDFSSCGYGSKFLLRNK